MNGKNRSAAGFTYLVVMFSVVLIGLSLSAAVQQWQTLMKREREAELLFRGDQIRQAIARYHFYQVHFKQAHPNVAYPKQLQDLIKLRDSSQTKRFLRKLYKDPITGEDWALVKVGDRIKGVYSPSVDAPMKQANFPEEYKGFEGKTQYKEWVFEYIPQQAQLPTPAQASQPKR